MEHWAFYIYHFLIGAIPTVRGESQRLFHLSPSSSVALHPTAILTRAQDAFACVGGCEDSDGH
jgi:hypothetical protein